MQFERRDLIEGHEVICKHFEILYKAFFPQLSLTNGNSMMLNVSNSLALF